jgi:cytochrome c-type biogenesis protein CcmH
MAPASPLFWVAALALVVVTLALLVVPLLRRGARAGGVADESATTAIFRDHKRQLEADSAAHANTDEQSDVALAELASRFGQELAQTQSPAVHTSERSRFVASIVLVACLPVIAGALYFTLGNPSAIGAASVSPHGANAENDPQLIAMVDQLAQRLQANPDDGEGWALLGRSYRVLGRYDAAVQAYGEAAKRLPPNAQLYTDWAEAIAAAQGRSLAGQPSELLERAIKLDPDNPKALALLGAAAVERDDKPAAVARWTRLRSVLPADSPQIAQVDAALARLGESGPAPAPAKAAAAAGNASVEGRVEIDPKLAKNIAPTDTVFIFARDPEGARMPLAASKFSGADLPRAFVLSDAMAMSPAATISKAGKVVVEVRVSKSGDVKPQAGDLTGTSAPVAPGARDVKVTIDRVVP